MPKRREEKPHEYRRRPDGELILPGFFDDSGGSGIVLLNKPAEEKTPAPDEKGTGK